MKLVSEKIAITFDDVLLVPQYSRVQSRHSVNLTMKVRDFDLVLPIIASPMDTVCESDMAIAMIAAGGLGIIHRFMSSVDQVDQVKKVKALYPYGKVGAAVSATGEFELRSHRLIYAGADIILVDVAHGHHKAAGDAVERLKNIYPNIHIMAGNVATVQGFKFLENRGADSIRVSVGGGSACDTRQVAGHGVPTLQAIIDISRSKHEAAIIADGGLRHSGDIAKAIAFGADAVMLGSLLAGTDESPGEIVDGKKVFRGMASKEAQEDWRGHVTVSEGVSTTIPYKGSVVDVLEELKGGLGSACSYSGVDKLKDLSELGQYMIISQASQKENLPHILNK